MIEFQTSPREHFGKYFVYESYDESSQIFHNDGSVGFVLRANPIVGASMNAQGEIFEFLQNDQVVKPSTHISFLLIGNDRIDHLLNYWKHFRVGEMFQNLAEKRKEFLLDLAKTNFIRDVNLVISFTIPKQDADIEELLRAREVLLSVLSSIGIFAEILTSKDLLMILRGIWCSSDDRIFENINPYEIFSQQILPIDFDLFEEEERVLLKNDEAFVALEFRDRPEYWHLSMMDWFLGNELRRNEFIKSDFLISMNIFLSPNQGLEKARAFAKREALEKNIFAGLGKFFPDLKAEAQDINKIVGSLQKGDRIVNMSLNVVLKSKKDRINDAVASFCSMLRRSDFNFAPCRYDQVSVMLSVMPMNGYREVSSYLRKSLGGVLHELNNFGRGIKTLASESKALLPIIGEWKGDISSPGMMLVGRRGQLLFWSPFGGALVAGSKVSSDENFNLCIAGVPGSGKSVFMQELMLSVLGVGGQVFVLDYGKSFRKLCLLLGGIYIEFDPRRPISINPFSRVPEGDDEKSLEAQQDFLSSFPQTLATMAAPQDGTNDLQQSVLQRALKDAWKAKGRKAEITDIAEWLLKREEAYAQELGHMLFPFTRNGQYGGFFNGEAELDLHSDVVVIETDHLRNIRDLLAVVVQIVITHINQSMVSRLKTRPFLIMIDEAWKLLAGKKSGEFIEEASRIARKYNGSITLATQQLTDFFREEGSASEKVFENASHKIILKQDPVVFKAMRANPKLADFVDSDQKLEFLQSINTNKRTKPFYSECAIYSPGVRGVIARLLLDPFTLLLTQTEAKYTALIESKIKSGMSLTQALNSILDESL